MWTMTMRPGTCAESLCFNCNGGLGQFGDDIERLEQAIEYLKGKRTPAAQAARAAEQRLLDLIVRLSSAA